MSTILLIEISATLRHALKSLLGNAGHEVIAASDFSKAVSLLRGCSPDDSTYDSVVVGWPTKTDPVADELFSLLEEPAFQAHPLLILAHEAEPAIVGWVKRRPRTDFLLWDNYTNADPTLGNLLATSRALAREPIPPQEDSRIIRILFVDDSPTIRFKYRRLLTKNDYHTEIASSVAEGMEKALASPFNIAIIDYFMPDASGDVLCRQLRDNPKTAGITTSIITGNYLDMVIKDALDAGAVECMFKNESDDLFLARIAAMAHSIKIHNSVSTERNRLECILGSVGDGVYGVDSDGCITFVNPATRRILGYSKTDALIGESAHALFHHAMKDGLPNPPETCFLQQAYRLGDELLGWETTFWHRSGNSIPVECTVYPLRIDDELRGSVVAFRDISERKLLEDELRWQASHDSLTKLFNRHHFEIQLGQEVNRLKRSKENSALIYLDLDRFKYINDTAGHAAGDQLLIEIGHKLMSRLRSSDALARLGGDEFAIIMRNVEKNGVYKAADSFREMLDRYLFSYNGRKYKVNGSIGVTLMNNEIRSAGEALANADIACHIAKNKGRNCTHVFVPESDQKHAMYVDIGWSSRLHNAIEENHFVLHYQPIIPLSSLDNCEGLRDGYPDTVVVSPMTIQNFAPMQFEALIRYNDINRGLIYPNAFLPTAERFNMMHEIDHWVINSALQTLKSLQLQGINSTFTINLSGQTIADTSLIHVINDAIEKLDINPGSLIFEITETSAISNIESAREIIGTLRRTGCRFALDDFGSGFCSFSHLKHLPVDFIKIDGLFVQGVANDSIDQAIVTSINEIAHSLGKQTIAEYVENTDILSFMRECGVDYVQGNYISPPMELTEIISNSYHNPVSLENK